MVHRVVWRVGSTEALDFWEQRLGDAGVTIARDGTQPAASATRKASTSSSPSSRPRTPRWSRSTPTSRRRSPSRASTASAPTRPTPTRAATLLEQRLAFEPPGDGCYKVRGERRGSWYRYDAPPTEPGVGGAGTVHHVAWASLPDEHEAWHQRVARAGARPTPVIDRFYFKSIYFREPSGVLFEIATIGPGFATDEPFESLGERLSLPPDFEHLRAQVEPLLTPLPNPRG